MEDLKTIIYIAISLLSIITILNPILSITTKQNKALNHIKIYKEWQNHLTNEEKQIIKKEISQLIKKSSQNNFWTSLDIAFSILFLILGSILVIITGVLIGILFTQDWSEWTDYEKFQIFFYLFIYIGLSIFCFIQFARSIKNHKKTLK